MLKNYRLIFLLVLVIALAGCGKDNGVNSDPGEPPALPEIQSEAAQPDISFFEDNQPKVLAKGDTANYYAARSWALWQAAGTFAFAGSYSGFLMGSNNEEAVYEDGMWVWEYSYQSEEGSFTMKLTSEEVSDGYKWAMYWSYDDGETSVDNYKILEGTVSEDGSEGNWTFNSLDTETSEERVAYTSEWTVTSDTESSMRAKWYDDSGTVTLTASFDKEAPDHTMSYTYPNEPNVTLYWNTDTNEGSFEQGGESSCWDENFKDIPCS